MAKVKMTGKRGQSLAEGIQAGETEGGWIPGTASISVQGERVPLTPEGLSNARATPAEVGRALADSARLALDTE
jgi:hypothetical protein